MKSDLGAIDQLDRMSAIDGTKLLLVVFIIGHSAHFCKKHSVLFCYVECHLWIKCLADRLNYLFWYSERFVVITRQLQAAKCSLSSQLFGHIFTLLENLRFPYCCSRCKPTFVRLVRSSLGPCIKNLLFNFH
jgi:hypothetical protein